MISSAFKSLILTHLEIKWYTPNIQNITAFEIKEVKMILLGGKENEQNYGKCIGINRRNTIT